MKRTQWRIHGPSTACRTCLNEKGRKHYYTGHEEEPVREHVQERRSHIPCAYLERDKDVGKGSAQSCCQYKEHQHSSVHSNQCIIKFRLYGPAFCPMSEKGFK